MKLDLDSIEKRCENATPMNPDFAWQLKWWAFGGRFPLIPQWRYKSENDHNTSGAIRNENPT